MVYVVVEKASSLPVVVLVVSVTVGRAAVSISKTTSVLGEPSVPVTVVV